MQNFGRARILIRQRAQIDVVTGATVASRMVNLDYAKASKLIREFISGYVSKSSSTSVVIGLSGGLDSSVVVKLCVQSLGKDRVFGLILPSKFTPKQDIDDAVGLADELGIRHEIIDIEPMLDKFMNVLPADRKAEGNLAARVRMSILYHHAFIKKSLVVGTGDKSEACIGFFTKFGDGGADLLPIADLYKIQVRALGKYLGLPPDILQKKSSPRLWKDHLAEGELGIEYEILDPILYLLVDKKTAGKDIARQLRIPISQVDQVLEMVGKSAHKRQTAQVCHLRWQ
jgi:NAD+ synthase